MSKSKEATEVQGNEEVKEVIEQVEETETKVELKSGEYSILKATKWFKKGQVVSLNNSTAEIFRKKGLIK